MRLTIGSIRPTSSLSVLAFTLLWTTGAYAQAAQDTKSPPNVPAATNSASAAPEANTAGAPVAAPEGPATDDIVVTAQFRSQRLQDTPLAISAVTADMMQARNQISVTDVAQRAPSITIEKSANGGGISPAITIRGVGQSDYFPAVEPGVGVYIDDVYYGIMIGSTFDLLDLDRVEVLRGPQGTLSGKNSVGGSLKLFTKAPSDTFGGYVEGTYGSYDRKQLRGAINIPIIKDKLAVRVSGIGRHVDGYVKRLDYGCVTGTGPSTGGLSVANGDCVLGREGGQDLTAVRASILATPVTGVRDLLIVDKINDKQETTPSKLIYQAFAPGVPYLTGPKDYTNYATYIGNPGTATAYQAALGNEVKQWGISNTLDVDIDSSLSLKSVTAYRKTEGNTVQEIDLSPLNTVLSQFSINNKQFTQELRLSGSVSKVFDWTVGAFYYRSNLVFPSRITLNFPFPLDFIGRDPIKSRSKSAFAHGVVHITDRLNVTGGLRYTKESKSYEFVRLDPLGGLLNPAGGPLNGLIAAINGVSNRYSGDKWDYRVAVDYRFSDQVLVYGQYATGFKGGGVNPRPFFATQAVPFNPETVKTLEAGVKTDLFDRRMRFNFTGFTTKYSGMQLLITRCDALSPFPGAPCSQTTNAGDSRLKGLEFELELRPTEKLSIDATGSILDFKYKSVNPASGISLDDTLPFVAKRKLAIGAQYAFDLFGGTLTPRLDYDYRSGFETEPVPNVGGLPQNLGRVKERGLFNARIVYKEPDGRWELAVAATNLADKFYYANRFDRTSPYQSVVGLPGRPREVSVSVKASF